MKRKQPSVAWVIGFSQEAEAGAVVTDLCRRHGMSSATFDACMANFGWLQVRYEAAAAARGGECPLQAAAGGYDARHSRPGPVNGAGLKDLPSNNGDARREAGRGRRSGC